MRFIYIGQPIIIVVMHDVCQVLIAINFAKTQYTITQLEETCISNCRLTWTKNNANSSNCNYGDGTTEFGDPGCVDYSDNQIIVEIDKKYCMTFDESDNIYMTYIGSCPYNSLLFLNQEIAGYGKNLILSMCPKMPLNS